MNQGTDGTFSNPAVVGKASHPQATQSHVFLIASGR